MPRPIEARTGADFRVRLVRPARVKVKFQRITKAAMFNFYFTIMRFLGDTQPPHHTAEADADFPSVLS